MTGAVRWQPRLILLRLVMASLLLIPAALWFDEAFVAASLPAYRLVFSRLLPDFEVQSMTLDKEGADRVVRVRVKPRPVMWVKGKALFPDPRGKANSSTLMAHALLCPLLACLVVLVWPARRWRVLGVRLLLLGPLVALQVMADVPSVLAAELWEIILQSQAPNSFSPLIVWKDFLQGGGRYALGLVAGITCVGLGDRLTLGSRTALERES